MLFFIVKGGVIMIPIILASIAGAAIIIERWIVLHRADSSMDMEGFSNACLDLVKKNKFQDALDLCRQNQGHPLAAMYAEAIENRQSTRAELDKVLERMGNHFVKILERRLGGLVSIVGIEPLLGFLGTIVGLIRAFMAWEKAGSDITVSVLAGGIYQAMITTAAGLIVAIPYYLFYNYFISRIKYFSHELEDYSSRLLELLTRGKVL